MPYLTLSSGIPIHYRDSGGGLPLLLLHGWGQDGAVWHRQDELADGFRLIVPDLRGHGDSGGHCVYSLPDLARDLSDFLEMLDLRDVLVVGWSLGGQVALGAFELIRQRIRGLVLVSSTPRFTAEEGYSHGLPGRDVAALAALIRRNGEKVLETFRKSMFSPQETDLSHHLAGIVQPPDKQALLETLCTLQDADLREFLSAVDLPVVLVHGSDDTICPPSASSFMHDRLQKATLHIIEGAGHAPFLTFPRRFNSIIRSLR